MAEVYTRLKWADALIIGTPVYQGMVSGQTKVIMDRCRAIAAQDLHFILNKPGAALPVGEGSFGANLGGAFWSKDKGREGAKEDEEGLKSMHRTVNRLMKLAMIIKKTKETYV